MNNSDQFWKFTEEPYGECPLQAEGTLMSGEKFYFRIRWGYASISISDMHSKHGLDNPIWETQASLRDLGVSKKRRKNDLNDKLPSNEQIKEIIDGFVTDYILSVEGTDHDENEVVSLETWRRRQYIKQRLQQQ